MEEVNLRGLNLDDPDVAEVDDTYLGFFSLEPHSDNDSDDDSDTDPEDQADIFDMFSSEFSKRGGGQRGTSVLYQSV